LRVLGTRVLTGDPGERFRAPARALLERREWAGFARLQP